MRSRKIPRSRKHHSQTGIRSLVFTVYLQAPPPTPLNQRIGCLRCPCQTFHPGFTTPWPPALLGLPVADEVPPGPARRDCCCSASSLSRSWRVGGSAAALLENLLQPVPGRLLHWSDFKFCSALCSCQLSLPGQSRGNPIQKLGKWH